MKHVIYVAILSAARGSGADSSENQIWCILAWKSDIRWDQFCIFPDFSKKNVFPWPLKFPDFFQFPRTCRNPEVNEYLECTVSVSGRIRGGVTVRTLDLQ